MLVVKEIIHPDPFDSFDSLTPFDFDLFDFLGRAT